MLKNIRKAAVLAAAVMLYASPAAAQNYPFDYGDLMEVTGIDILDGGGYEYATWLASEWRKQNEYAKSQGWISDYKVYSNIYPREGEPDIYLLITMKNIPDAAEATRRDDAYRAYMKTTDAKMVAESGNRGKFRKVMSQTLLGELTFKK